MNPEKLMRENIIKLNPYTSARDNYLEGILLDANENGFGSVTDNSEYNRYPDPNHNTLRRVAGEVFNLKRENLFFGVGSDEIIDLLIRIFCRPGFDNVIVTTPSYGMYKVACHVNDVNVKTVELKPDFTLDVGSILEASDENTKIVFLCSPNNPTANLLSGEDILNVCRKLNAVIVVDEAYIDFCEENTLIHHVAEYNNLVVTRTFSKAWGLAGLRCGFSVADKTITEVLYKVKAPYNLNQLTQNIILKALKKIERRNQLIRKIIDERVKLIVELNKIDGVQKVFPSDTNFLLFRVNNADQVYRDLVACKVIIRNRSSLPLINGCLRVTVGNEEENKMFIKELKRVL